MRRLAWLLVALVSPQAAWAGPVDVAAELRAGEPVRVDIAFGDLTLVAGEAGRITVTGDVDDGIRGVRLRRDGGAMEVRTVLPLRGSLRRLWHDEPRLQARLRIELPPDTPVFLVQREGTASAEGLRGPFGAFTIAADLEVRGTPSRVDVETVTGALRFRGDTPSLRASTLSGFLSAEGQVERAVLESVDGELRCQSPRLGAVTLRSVSGDITLEGDLTAHAEAVAETHAGSIDVTIATGDDLQIRAASAHGGVRAERNGEAVPQSLPNRLEIPGDSGERSLRLETHSGAVEIRLGRPTSG